MSDYEDRPTFPVPNRRYPKKIALEEAVSTSVFNATATVPVVKTGSELTYTSGEYNRDVERRLTDFKLRVQSMDEAGVAQTVVSLTMPGIEGVFDADTAVDFARRVNDEIHDVYVAGEHADRFRAFACVPLQRPKAAAAEAIRAVQELGAVGVLVNGYSNVGDAKSIQYLDEPQCAPFWAAVEELDVPVYLHPRIPASNQLRSYRGLEFLSGSPWGFGAETAIHALRLMVSGLFDRHPHLKIILGHCGEGLPFSLPRIDARLRHFQPELIPAAKTLQTYWERNFWVTTAGVFSENTLADTLRSCGSDRVLFSVDYPYENYQEIGAWFDGLELDAWTRAKVGWENAAKLLKLPA